MIYRLPAQPPIRAYALAALLCLLGAGLLGGALFADWPGWFLGLGLGFFLLGLALLGAATFARQRQQVEVELTDQGYAIRGAAEPLQGTWESVTKVTQSQTGGLTLHHGGTARTHLLPAKYVNSEQLTLIGKEIARHLDKSRGYQSF